MLAISLIFAASVFYPADGREPQELKYRLEEEQGIGTYIGNVIQDANLAAIYNESTLRQLQFRFLKNSDLFLIDDTRGTLSTATRIDREATCPGADVCDVRLDVVIQPHVHFRIIRIDVTILDVNDNAPRFDATDKVVGVLETAAVGTVLHVPTATDPDSPEFAVSRYRLVSDSDRFELADEERKPDGSFDTKLVLVRSLDRELVDNYYLKILAVDGGYPQNTGSININIRVLDVNDNKPVFDTAVYNVTVKEDIRVNSTIIQVAASDQDVGFNGEVLYSFSLQTLTAYGRLFGIDNRTGEIYVRQPLDHEDSANYRLTVVAQDGGLESVPVTATVIVTVDDVNDNPPRVTMLTLSAESRVAEIAEDSRMGTFVAQVTVVDADSGENGRFSCQLNDSHFAMVPVYDSEFQLVTTAALDRESRAEYHVALTCTDFGSDPQVSREDLRVVVADVNDNDPVFGQPVYRGELHENNYIGAVLFQVNATDRDVGPNSQVTFRIEDAEAAARFAVDPDTGAVRALVSFDREDTDQLRFYVVATDHGSPPRSGSVLATVTILDVNDERPVFSQTGYSFAVHENQPAGTDVGAVAAVDRDSSVYGDLTYSVVPVHGFESFEVDHKSGMITTLREFDRETNPSFLLVVVASDRGVPPLANTATATIYVSDENDNDPIFDYPSPSNATVYLSNRAPRGHVVTRLRAHDADVGRNAKVYFEMSDSTRIDDIFHLDAELGTIVVRADLLELDGQQYALEFLAKDEGDPQRIAFARLNIVVNRSVAFLLDPEDDSGSPMTRQNFTIVIVLAAISVVIIVVLIGAITVVCRQDRKKQTHKYNCRTETLRMLSKGMKPSSSDCSDVSAAAQHGSVQSTAEDKVRKDFVLATGDSNLRLEYEIDDRSLPRYCTSTFDQQVSAQNSMRSAHYYPSPSIKSSNASLHLNGSSVAPLDSYPPPDKLSGGNNPYQDPKAYNISQNGQSLHPAHHPHHHHQSSRDKEVERLLKALQRGDRDADSVHSEEGSNADSGHGPSEEGEGLRPQVPHHHHTPANVQNDRPSSRSRSPAPSAKRS